MRKNLLLTTALVIVGFSVPAMAENGASGLLGKDAVLSGSYKGLTNTDEKQAGVATVDEGVTGVSVASGTEFIGNKTMVSAGGALKLLDSIEIGNNVKFDNNKAEGKAWGGGAIYLRDRTAGQTTIGKNATFTNNNATFGGALGIEAGNLKIEDGALFEGNHATEGGAIALWTDKGNGDKSSEVVLGKTIFRKNTSTTHGGAISNLNNATNETSFGHKISIGDGSLFEENSSHAGGAIFGAKQSEVSLGNNVEFIKNTAAAQVKNGPGDAGGAIYLTDSKLTAGNNVKFSGNEALSEEYKYSDGNKAKGAAGAIYSYNSDVELGNNAVFENNKSQYAAGAVYNWNNGKGKFTLGDNAQFLNNESIKSYGGAIGNFDGDMTIGKNAVFVGNKAGTNGGAIANMLFSQSSSTLKIGDGAVFENNTAETGGAIYNDEKGTVTLYSATFSKNKDGKGLNDMHNAGNVIVTAGSTLTLDGGISGEGTTELGSSTKLNVKDTTKIENTLTTAGTELNVTLSSGATELDLKKIFEQGVDEKMKLNTKNALYNLEQTKDDSNVYTITQKQASEVASNLGVSASTVTAVLAAVSGASTANESFNSVSEALNEAAQKGDGKVVAEVTKLGAEVAPVVRVVETSRTNMLFAAVNDELNGEGKALAENTSVGDCFRKVKAWVRGLFNNADYDGTSKAQGFDTDTYGVTMGIDKELDNHVKAGFGYAYSQTDVNGDVRDTDVDTNTLFVYGQYKPADWYVNTALAYSWSDYEEKKSVLGYNADAKYDVDTIALEGMYGFERSFGAYDVNPEFGFRYMHISQDGYTDNLGTRVKSKNSDILTAVAGAKVSKPYELESGMVLRPELKAAVTYDVVSDDNNANVMLANGAGYRMSGEKLERLGFEFGAKVATDVSDKWEVGAGYEVRLRKDYSDNTLMLNAKYQF